MKSNPDSNPEPLMPDNACLHVWDLDLTLAQEDNEHLAARLTPEELQHAQAIHHPVKRREYMVSHAWMNQILCRYLGRAPDFPVQQLPLRWQAHGKPYLEDTRLQFNLSHSGSRAAMVVARSHAVGIDIQEQDRYRDLLGLAQRFYSAAEEEFLQSLHEEERIQWFYRLWCGKEAALKSTGVGLGGGLQKVPLYPWPRADAPVQVPAQDAQWTSTYVLELDLAAGFSGAVASAGPVQHLEYFSGELLVL